MSEQNPTTHLRNGAFSFLRLKTIIVAPEISGCRRECCVHFYSGRIFTVPFCS